MVYIKKIINVLYETFYYDANARIAYIYTLLLIAWIASLILLKLYVNELPITINPVIALMIITLPVFLSDFVISAIDKVVTKNKETCRYCGCLICVSKMKPHDSIPSYLQKEIVVSPICVRCYSKILKEKGNKSTRFIIGL